MYSTRLPELSSVTGENPYLFNGKEYEDDCDLNWYHYGARYYDPQLGRWHSIDPVSEFVSPYMFCRNNPIRFIDSDGRVVWDSEILDQKFYQDAIATTEGSRLISQFKEEGRFEDHILVIKVDDSLWSSGQQSSEFVRNDSGGETMVHYVWLKPGELSNTIGSDDYLNMVDATIHEVQHAQGDALYLQNMSFELGEKYNSSYLQVEQRISVLMEVSNTYDLGLTTKDAESITMYFKGWDQAYYNETKKMYGANMKGE